jgi:hypothetical protein
LPASVQCYNVTSNGKSSDRKTCFERDIGPLG